MRAVVLLFAAMTPMTSNALGANSTMPLPPSIESEPAGIVISGFTRGGKVMEPFDDAALKIRRPGTLLGKALEPLAEGAGEVLVFLTPQSSRQGWH